MFTHNGAAIGHIMQLACHCLGKLMVDSAYSTLGSTSAFASKQNQSIGYNRIANNLSKTAQQNSIKHDVETKSSFKIINKLIYITGTLLVIAACMFAYAHQYGDVISRGGHTIDDQPLSISIGLDQLSIPANGIRYAHHRQSGPTENIKLYRHWPSLSGYTDDLKEEFNADSKSSSLVFLTLEPRQMSFDMSGRIEQIYKRFFVGIGIREDFGLVRQGLASDGGFIDEDLYYAADSPYPYAARCVRENSDIATPFCIRDIHLGKNLMLTYRFHKRFLPQWIELDQALRTHVRSMITNL